MYHYTKKETKWSLGIIGQYLCYLPYLKYLKKLRLNRSLSILHQTTKIWVPRKPCYRTSCPWICRQNKNRNGPKENSLLNLPGPVKGVWYAKPRHFINDTSVLRHTRHSLKLVSKLFDQTYTVCPVQWYVVIYKRNRNSWPTGMNSMPPSLYHIHEWYSHCEPQIYFYIVDVDTTLISALCSFIHCNQSDVENVSTMINMKLIYCSLISSHLQFANHLLGIWKGKIV